MTFTFEMHFKWIYRKLQIVTNLGLTKTVHNLQAFLNEKLYLYLSFIRYGPQGSKWQLFSNGLGNSVVPNRHQPSVEPVMTQYTDKCASPGHNVLTHGSLIIIIGYNWGV